MDVRRWWGRMLGRLDEATSANVAAQGGANVGDPADFEPSGLVELARQAYAAAEEQVEAARSVVPGSALEARVLRNPTGRFGNALMDEIVDQAAAGGNRIQLPEVAIREIRELSVAPLSEAERARVREAFGVKDVALEEITTVESDGPLVHGASALHGDESLEEVAARLEGVRCPWGSWSLARDREEARTWRPHFELPISPAAQHRLNCAAGYSNEWEWRADDRAGDMALWRAAHVGAFGVPRETEEQGMDVREIEQRTGRRFPGPGENGGAQVNRAPTIAEQMGHYTLRVSALEDLADRARRVEELMLGGTAQARVQGAAPPPVPMEAGAPLQALFQSALDRQAVAQMNLEASLTRLLEEFENPNRPRVPIDDIEQVRRR